jgi:hypothetical protein
LNNEKKENLEGNPQRLFEAPKAKFKFREEVGGEQRKEKKKGELGREEMVNKRMSMFPQKACNKKEAGKRGKPLKSWSRSL